MPWSTIPDDRDPFGTPLPRATLRRLRHLGPGQRLPEDVPGTLEVTLLRSQVADRQPQSHPAVERRVGEEGFAAPIDRVFDREVEAIEGCTVQTRRAGTKA